MDKKYTIEWVEIKKEGETNGRPWKITEMNLKDEAGVITDKVSTFDNVMAGQVIEGQITTNDKGYLNFQSKKAEAKANFKTAQTEKLMERKETSIGKFQDSKEWSIKLASSMGKAIDLALAEDKEMNDESRKLSIKKWREWILRSWDIDPTDIPPFNSPQ